MSEKTVRRLWLRNAVGFCLLIPGATQAQTAEELRARVAILEERWKEADELARRAAALRRPEMLSDTFRMGPVMLTATSDDPALVRAARPLALQLLEDDMGQGLGVLRGLNISVSIRLNQVYDLGPHAVGFARGTTLREGRRAEDLAAHLAQATYAALDMNSDASLWNWLPSRPLPRNADQLDLVRAYTDLVTSPFEGSTQCLHGDVGACRRALGLVETPDPLTDWYTQAGRRALVDRAPRPPDRFFPADAVMYDRCVAGREDQACQTILRTLASIDPPLPSNVRETLAYHALDMGGDGAYGRFFTTDSSIEQRLEAAAGVPIEALIRSWRVALDEAVGEPTAVSWPLGLMSALWVVALAALGVRSTRWR